MNLAILGVNFKTAPLEIRERASLNPQEAGGALVRLSSAYPDAEFVLVSTCNRTELYVAGLDVPERAMELAGFLLKDSDEATRAGLEKHFYVKEGREAARHLLAVTASLDSMVVGEAEIVGQVKQAFTLAAETGAHSRGMTALFEHAFRCAKRVHTETDICRGRVSVSSLAVEFAEKVFEDLGAKTIMIVGAGETAELALKSLVERGAKDVLVLNRSLEKGEALAARHGGRAVRFELLDEYLCKADIVISSTSAPHVVIHAESMRNAMRARRGMPVLLIDIAVPRDIDPAAGDIKDVYLYHIDDLQRVAEGNLARRREAVDKAWCIVEEVTGELVDLFKVRGVGAMMRRLDEHGRVVCDAILGQYMGREKLAGLPEASKEEIRTLAQKIVNKMLAAPRKALREAARNGDWDSYAALAAQLLGLDEYGPDDEGKPDGQDNKTTTAGGARAPTATNRKE